MSFSEPSIPDPKFMPQSTATAHYPARSKGKLNLRLPLLLISLIAGLGFGAWFFSRQIVSTVLQVSGRLEGYETDIGAKIGGRVKSVNVREGDRIQKSQVIAELDDQEIQAQLQGVTARLAIAKQQQQQAFLQIGIIQNKIQEAELNRQQSQDDAYGRIFQATSTAAATEAQLSQKKAEYTQQASEVQLAKVNRIRYEKLVRNGAVSQQQFDEANTRWETSNALLQSKKAEIKSVQKQVNASQGALTQAETSALNPMIRKTQIDVLQQQFAVTQSQLKAAREEVLNAKAAQKQILVQLAYLKVISPINGVVIARSVEPGAVVGSGRTLLTVINPSTVYLRGYIPEGEIGKVKVGQSAKVFLDSQPNQGLSAHISAIDTEASFTPENIYFYQDRVKQTFGIKISIDQPGGYAKPGMPADAKILLNSQE
jgi:HlyD family secretion protein